MKGYLKKTEQGWFVIYDQILGEGIVKRNQNALPLHPLDVKQIDEDSKVFDNIEARIKAYPDVEFEIETKLVFDRPSYSSIEVPKYAKLINKEDIKPKQCNTWDDIFDKIESEMDCVVPLKVVNYLEKYYKKPELLFSQTDEKGKPLTYWGGVDFTNSNTNNITSNSTQIYQKEIQGYICPITKIQCDDECCVSAENCHIVDTTEMILDDCEEVKNWDNFAEQKNLELLAEINYPMCEWAEEQCLIRRLAFINGYKKAKETLYTEEQVREAMDFARGHHKMTDTQFMQSLK